MMITTDTHLPLASKGLSQLEPLYLLALLKLPIYESPLPSAIPMAIPSATPIVTTNTLASTPCESRAWPVGDRRKLRAKVMCAVDRFLLSSVGINGRVSKYEGCSQSASSS